ARRWLRGRAGAGRYQTKDKCQRTRDKEIQSPPPVVADSAPNELVVAPPGVLGGMGIATTALPSSAALTPPSSRRRGMAPARARVGLYPVMASVAGMPTGVGSLIATT